MGSTGEVLLVDDDARMRPPVAKVLAPETSIILTTAFGSIDTAVQAIKAGAYDYLTKSFKMDEVNVVVRHAMEELRLRAEVWASREELLLVSEA
jgi:DNA-binding NtrC family response regulator